MRLQTPVSAVRGMWQRATYDALLVDRLAKGDEVVVVERILVVGNEVKIHGLIAAAGDDCAVVGLHVCDKDLADD